MNDEGAGKIRKRFRLLSQILAYQAVLWLLVSCGSNSDNRVIISVKDQKMLLLEDGEPTKIYPVSTSKFGLGSQRGSMRTPLGKMKVARKIGKGAPAGAVFKSRRRTGEILPPNAPGRDPIVTRILWLKGTQHHNRNTYSRYIYIHGTPEERNIGSPVSYGCIRMNSHDIIDLYKRLSEESDVKIIRGSLRSTRVGRSYAQAKVDPSSAASS